MSRRRDGRGRTADVNRPVGSGIQLRANDISMPWMFYTVSPTKTFRQFDLGEYGVRRGVGFDNHAMCPRGGYRGFWEYMAGPWSRSQDYIGRWDGMDLFGFLILVRYCFDAVRAGVIESSCAAQDYLGTGFDC